MCGFKNQPTVNSCSKILRGMNELKCCKTCFIKVWPTRLQVSALTAGSRTNLIQNIQNLAAAKATIDWFSQLTYALALGTAQMWCEPHNSPISCKNHFS